MKLCAIKLNETPAVPVGAVAAIGTVRSYRIDAACAPHDFVCAACVATPGVTLRNEDVMPLADYHRSAICRHFSKSSGIEHTLATAIADSVTTAGELIDLFRADPAAPFTDAERDLKQQLTPHLVAA